MHVISIFRKLANLISVSDIYTPFLSKFESNRSVADVNEEWSIDLCSEHDFDPMNQIGLVITCGKIDGWIGFDMLESNKKLIDCIEKIDTDAILSSDTSIIDALTVFSKKSHPFFFIIKGDHFIGWLSYQDMMHKPPLRLCLFAMLLHLEKLMLDVVLLTPRISVELLSPGRFIKAKDIYLQRGFNLDDQNNPYNSQLLECTAICDKFTIIQKNKSVLELIPSLKNKKICNIAEKLRNEIAHPGFEERSSLLLSIENLLPFIEWSEQLELELQNYLKLQL